MRVELDFVAVLSQWPLLVKGVAWTVGLTVISAVIGVVIGIAFAWSRSHGSVWLKAVVGTYVELIRNTPFIVQLFFVLRPAGCGCEALTRSGIHHRDGDQPQRLCDGDHPGRY